MTKHPTPSASGPAPTVYGSPDWLFAQQCDFIYGSQNDGDFPAPTVAEVAFVGRSNVGKSSLINMLTNRKTLARASNTPGRTRQINFFDLGGKLRLIDLPGYGYAKISRTEHQQWEALMLSYLRNRAPLRRVLLLIDARHGMKDSDAMMMRLLDVAAVPYQCVLTKTDKVKQTELEKTLASVRQQLIKHPAALPEPLATSASNRYGRDALRAELAALV